jgi:HEAT repeat protein
MTIEELLQECETLTYDGRAERMARLGQLAVTDQNIAQTLAELAQGDVYQRMLATLACYGSRDSGQVLRSLTDVSRLIRARATRLVALVCSDAEVQQALELLSPDFKYALVRALLQRRRQEALNLYLETLAARNDPFFKEILFTSSRELVTRFFAQVAGELDLASLTRLARHYPDLVVHHLRELAQASTTSDPHLLFQVNTLMPHLSKHAPDLALDLVKALMASVPLSSIQLHVLVLKRPDEVAELALLSDDRVVVNFDRVAHRLQAEHLLKLGLRFPGLLNYAFFEKLRPTQRTALYAAFERGWRNAEGVLPYALVKALPAAGRLQEGRRHLALPTLATRPLEQLPYAAFLPWEEARNLLDTRLRSPDADLRGAALSALITATRYQREHLTDALELVLQRPNEQDPVRRSMLTAMAELPHSIWQTEHLTSLARILNNALNAIDLSHATARSMERLVVHLFPFHPQWSAEQMALIYSKRGNISVYQLESYLSDADVRRMVPALLPILQAWQQRENEGLLVALATALGKRLRVFDELIALLETTLESTLNKWVAERILLLFLEHLRKRATVIIPELLKKDQSAITLTSVHTYLHEHRQDLLTPFLGQHAYKGRFDTGRTRFVILLNDGFYRWTPSQQELFKRTHLEVIDTNPNNQNRATSELMASIQRIAAMPMVDVAPLIAFASDERQPVRDKALFALGRLDAGQGVPVLLEALNDERGRVAIYALRQALLSMPAGEALRLLRAAPLEQVTVAKEIVRLIGELSSDEAYQTLLELEQRTLHRDVRVALLRALWSHAEQLQTWEIFTRAAQDADIALARGVVHIPMDGLSPFAQRQLVQLSATLLAHPATEVRMDTLQWRSQYPLTDTEQVLFTQLLALLQSPFPDEYTWSAKAIFSIYADSNPQLIGEAVRSLLNRQQALQAVCAALASTLPYRRSHFIPTTRAVLAALEEDRLTIAWRVELLIKGLPWEEIAPELARLANDLHADALERAKACLLQTPLLPEEQLMYLEEALSSSDDERLRRLALVALLAQTRQSGGWSDERIARLEKYRNDAAPLVAEAAQFTFVV